MLKQMQRIKYILKLTKIELILTLLFVNFKQRLTNNKYNTLILNTVIIHQCYYSSSK